MINPIFVCHGGPTLAIEENEYTNFLKALGESVKPKAIVIFSAHFENEITTISSIDTNYKMIYDFYGFPKELYNIEYKAIGSKNTSEKVQKLLSQANIGSKADTDRGIDHGSWVMLKLMYPEADIPVVQISVNPNLPMEKQFEIGKAIRNLSIEDILIIGSGATVHNLRTIDWTAKETKPWALEFDNWLIKNVESKNYQDLFHYKKQAPNAKLAVPTEEHLAPLFIAMGAGREVNNPKLLHQSYEYGSLSYLCFKF